MFCSIKLIHEFVTVFHFYTCSKLFVDDLLPIPLYPVISWLANFNSRENYTHCQSAEARHPWQCIMPIEPKVASHLYSKQIFKTLKEKYQYYQNSLSSMPDCFSAWLSMSLENHSLNSSWESNNVGIMKWSNAHNWNDNQTMLA